MRKVILVSLILGSLGFAQGAWAETACFEVRGMTCATCPITVKAAVKKIKGVNEVKVSLKEKNAFVDFDPQNTNATEIKNVIDEVGYKAISQECKNDIK